MTQFYPTSGYILRFLSCVSGNEYVQLEHASVWYAGLLLQENNNFMYMGLMYLKVLSFCDFACQLSSWKLVRKVLERAGKKKKIDLGNNEMSVN